MASTFNRPPRQQWPSLPAEEIDIPPPPGAAPPPSNNWLIGVLPVMGIGVMALFYVWRAATVRGSSALFAIPLFILAIFAIGGTVVASRWRLRDHYRREQERTLAYIRLLEKKRARLQAAHNAHAAVLAARFPAPENNLDRSLDPNASLWERRPDDLDFMLARVGVGRVPSPVPISLPDPDADAPELERAMRIADYYRHLEQAPVVVPLGEAVGVCGRRDLVLSAVRAMVCHLALAHSPTDLQIFVVSASREDWSWLRAFPHVNTDGDHLASDPLAVRTLLGSLSQVIDSRQKAGTQRPHLLVIFDNPQLAESEAVYNTILQGGVALGVSGLCLTATYDNVPGPCEWVVDLHNNGAFRVFHAGGHVPTLGDAADTLPVINARLVGRGLAGVRLRESGMSGRIPRRVDLLDIYGVQRVGALKAALRHNWDRPVPDGVLPHPVPIGRESLTANMTLMLDEDHHGPHGVLAGTTGSGKSELLQTLVCALALEHDPRLLNFLLLDFKGGSTFSPFAGLPHTVGTVTNLDGERVGRALAALRAEIKYRQQFLKQLNLRDITQYYRFHVATPGQLATAQPLPHLLIIVDEFAQLAHQMPDFMAELVRTAQVGRSLGLHLILGTQSPMEVVTEEMNANLQFRICLRVQNAEASRAMLRRPDAAYLPAGLAGRGYFMVGERGVYKQFQTAYVGGDYTEGPAAQAEQVLAVVEPDGNLVNLLDDQQPGPLTPYPADAEPYTTAAALVDVIRDFTEAHDLPYMPPLLLPPLEERLTLEEAFIHLDFGGWSGRGWDPPGHDENGGLIPTGSAPAGLVDDVFTRRQYPLWVHLNDTEGGGHLLVMGGPGSGKTTFLQTLALGLAWLHSPVTLHIYPLSFSGGGLNVLGNLPHAERAIHGTETERVRRLFGRLETLLIQRQTSRQNDHQPKIVLLLEGYEGFRDAYYEHHMGAFDRLIAEGRSVGIFVVFTAAAATAVPERTRALVPQRVALKLNNAGDYLLAVGETPTDANLPPGRGVIPGTPPLVCQVSLPVFGAVAGQQEIDTALRRIVNDMRQGFARYGGRMQGPAPITELASVILLDSLPREGPAPGPLHTTLGQVDDDDLSTFTLNWAEHGPHFIVTGPPASGKTNLLFAAALAAALKYPPEYLRFLLVDLGGRSLAPLEPLKHVITRVTNSLEMETQFRHLATELTALRGAAAPPRTVLLVDDYEIAADVMSMNLDLLRGLRDHVRLHTDAGLHLWAAGYLERVGDPLIKQLLLRRSGFALSDRDSLHNLNVRATVPAASMPAGRAYFAQHNRVQVVQTALVDDPPAYVDYVNHTCWPTEPPADWQHAGGQSLPSTGAPPAPLPPTETGPPDIDVNGLIDDLLGG